MKVWVLSFLFFSFLVSKFGKWVGEIVDLFGGGWIDAWIPYSKLSLVLGL